MLPLHNCRVPKVTFIHIYMPLLIFTYMWQDCTTNSNKPNGGIFGCTAGTSMWTATFAYGFLYNFRYLMLRATTTHRTTMNQAKGHFALQGKAMWIPAFAYSFGYNSG